ncbi:hypothetical protein N8J89_37515 [Crossiella sp. CA-258035]|uniref:hypothetical protein n=1 Tax=Crossiella sp. CA-258035 TaxID=2981138 RepID=UPI0024BC529D|nr:hypothetical protein [Crossiella sp. CA-258035]WHT18745.1 hypothetical protein N8J89_37515 [Crossiella sp. CA-258035]
MKAIGQHLRRLGRALIRRWWRIPVLAGVVVIGYLLIPVSFNLGLFISAGIAPGLAEWWVAGDERAADVG